jgi:hypothetical protein
MNPVAQFARALFKKWGTYISGAVVAGIGIYQGFGHPVAHWVYWLVVFLVGLVVACYQTWLDQWKQVEHLTSELAGVRAGQASQGERLRKEQKRELMETLSLLRVVKMDTDYWLDLSNDKWGMTPDTVNLLHGNWGKINFALSNVSNELRDSSERVYGGLSKANALITQFLNMEKLYRKESLIKEAHDLLAKHAPMLDELIKDTENYERSLC